MLTISSGEEASAVNEPDDDTAASDRVPSLSLRYGVSRTSFSPDTRLESARTRFAHRIIIGGRARLRDVPARIYRGKMPHLSQRGVSLNNAIT